jgi:hypothetical protein
MELFLITGAGIATVFAAGLAGSAVWEEAREILSGVYEPLGRVEKLLPLRGRWLALLLNAPRLVAWGLMVFFGVLGAVFVFATVAAGILRLVLALCGMSFNLFR